MSATSNEWGESRGQCVSRSVRLTIMSGNQQVRQTEARLSDPNAHPNFYVGLMCDVTSNVITSIIISLLKSVIQHCIVVQLRIFL